MSVATQVRERPMLFNGEMVRAIREGRKTKTRRVVNPRYPFEVDEREDGSLWPFFPSYVTGEPDVEWLECPFGEPGDRLWGRETYRGHTGSIVQDGAPDGYELCLAYAAGGYSGTLRVDSAAYNRHIGDPARRWRPSIHMPRWASRITLEITEVRVERVREITEEDARAEGCSWSDGAPEVDTGQFTEQPYEAREEFQHLWNAVSEPRFGWDADPFVWVVSFRRVEP